MPSRIRRQRSRGWRQPINAIYVGRPTKWGNPYKAGIGHHTAEEAVTLYRIDLIAGSLPFTIDDVRRELKGKEARISFAGVNPVLLVTLMYCLMWPISKWARI
jgi:Domain of unknown function (DUF4326)